jgi:hypothetical protein
VPGKQIAAIVGCAEGDGGHLARPLRRARPGRPGGSAAAGQAGAAARGAAGSGAGADADRAADQFGATHWSSRLLATALAGEGTPISHATIARIWHRFGVQPWRAGRSSSPPTRQLEAKIRDVVGLYLHPPEKAVVLCVDEKPQIQALERTARPLPVRPGSPARQTSDYVRHGTTTSYRRYASFLSNASAIVDEVTRIAW